MNEYSHEDIFDIVKSHLTDVVEEIEPGSVNREASMKDLGASSLDIVEVVSFSMRQLRVRVPRTELVKLTNIGGLVDLLHAAVVEKQAN